MKKTKNIFLLIILLLLVVGCSNNDKDLEEEYAKYGIIKYGEKAVDVMQKYQYGDLSYKEAREKLDVISSSIRATSDSDMDLYRDRCINKVENDELLKIRVDGMGVTSSLLAATVRSFFVTDGDSKEVENLKQEIIDIITKEKEDIKNCE